MPKNPIQTQKGPFTRRTAGSVNATVRTLSVLDGSLRCFVSEKLTAPLHHSVNRSGQQFVEKSSAGLGITRLLKSLTASLPSVLGGIWAKGVPSSPAAATFHHSALA